MPNDLLPILQALTRKHQKYLITKYAERLVTKPKLKNNDERLKRLAEVLGADIVGPYRHAYMHRASRFVALFEPASGAVTVRSIEAAIAKRYRRWSVACEPKLTTESAPQFNKMEKLADESLWIDFVSLSDETLIPDGYGFRKGVPIHHDWVTVHATPNPTIEIAARTSDQRDIVMKALSDASGLKPDAFTLRAFDRPGQWKGLQAHFSAEICGHQGNRRAAKEPAAYSMHAKRGERLDDLTKWKALSVNHEDARELGFFSESLFNLDGYPEQVFYFLQTHTGQIKFPDDISEYARKQVVNEYLSIA